VTASFGVAEFEPPDDLNSLLKRADDALYRAKDKGRSRVEALIGEITAK
jgi:PleD family two-component response regulator